MAAQVPLGVIEAAIHGSQATTSYDKFLRAPRHQPGDKGWQNPTPNAERLRNIDEVAQELHEALQEDQQVIQMKPDDVLLARETSNTKRRYEAPGPQTSVLPSIRMKPKDN